MGKVIDMTGWVMKEHGVPNSKITVLYELPEKKNHKVYWHCKCDCGNECDVCGSNLRNGNTLSCGCLHKQLLKAPKTNIPIGSKYGLLTVIELLNEQNSDGKYYYLCKCDCGNFKKVIAYHLQNHNVSSCGCKKIFKGENLVKSILKENNICFEQQKFFNDCRFEDTKYPAYFDFYVDNKYIIEYDGSQHFETKNSGWNTQETLIKTQEHDNFKNQYCFKHNIPIIRIPYWHYNDLCLEDLIPETSQFLLKQEE